MACAPEVRPHRIGAMSMARGAQEPAVAGRRRLGSMPMTRVVQDLSKAERPKSQEPPASQASTHAPSPVVDAAPGYADAEEAATVADATQTATRKEEAVHQLPHTKEQRRELVRCLSSCLAELSGAALAALFSPQQLQDRVVPKAGKAIDMLLCCDVHVEDICSVLAHTSVYWADVAEAVGEKWDAGEAANVLVLLMYVAHSYVLDVTCPLRCWHKYLFKRYCNVHTLNAACLRLLQIRGYALRVQPDTLERRYAKLLEAAGIVDSGVPAHA